MSETGELPQQPSKVPRFSRAALFGRKPPTQLTAVTDNQPSNNPDNTPETISEKLPKTTRRKLISGATNLAMAAALADVGTGHLPGLPSATKGFFEQLESVLDPVTNVDRKTVEETFGISILSPQDGNSFVQSGTFRIPLYEPDLLRLNLLYKTLQNLPEKFTAPVIIDGQEKPLRVGFTNTPFTDTQTGELEMGSESFCDCGVHFSYDTKTQQLSTTPNDSLIVFQTYMLGQTLPERKFFNEAEGIIVHELTHYLTMKDIDHYVKNICYPLGIKNNADLSRIFLGSPDAKVSKMMGGTVLYGATNLDEFMAVAGEFYIHGRDKFIQRYTKYLGEEKSALLYSLVKREIFEDKEY